MQGLEAEETRRYFKVISGTIAIYITYCIISTAVKAIYIVEILLVATLKTTKMKPPKLILTIYFTYCKIAQIFLFQLLYSKKALNEMFYILPFKVSLQNPVYIFYNQHFLAWLSHIRGSRLPHWMAEI